MLLKINTFEQWLTTSSDNNNAKVRGYAHQQIVKMLHGEHKITLTDQQKQVFLTDNKYNSLLEPWLQVETDGSIIIALIKKINKPHLANQLFIQKQNEVVQQYLVDQVDDITLLEKFIKKSVNANISTLIDNKINTIKELAEKPIKLKKKIQLVLAKLLALKDVTDYNVYLNKKSDLEGQWQESQADFTCLAAEQTQLFNQKYQEITLQLDKIFIVKQEAYQQQLIEQQLVDEKIAAKKEFDQKLAEHSQTLTTSVFENTLIDNDQFTSELTALTTKVNTSVLNEKEKPAYISLIKQHAERLTQLPEIAKLVTEATGLIAKISQLAIPTNLAEYIERQPIFNDWLKSWQAIEKQTSGILPNSIKSAYQEIRSAWQKGLRPFAEQEKSLFNQTQKKLGDLKRLLATGKYNASFGLFKGIEKNFVKLSSSQQYKLERDFEKVSKQIADLSDWEHYIATPRKQQLLDEINAIVACPLDNPNDQASKVKEFRKAWNLLGHADDELDKPLNEAFNLACEQAFSPCRLFFSEQEKLREQHLASRIAIIEQAKKLIVVTNSTEQVDFKNLDGQLNKLNQAWSEAGEVDRNKYRSLQHDFSNTLEPLKVAMRNFHDQNATLKNSLIEKVTVELDNQDIYAAIENTKKFQQQWRDIGFAGSRQDNKLWQSFRAVNDQLFQKRELMKADEKEQQSSQKLAFEQQLTSIRNEFSLKCDKSQLVNIKKQVQDLHQQVVDSKPVIKSVAVNIESFVSELNNQIKVIEQAQEKNSWLSIFSVMQTVATSEVDKESVKESTDYLAISPKWQKKLLDNIFTHVSDSTIENRQVKTLELEILAGIDSPKELSSQRMEIQVQLMQDKMSSGSEVNLEQSFNDWLMQGQLATQDLPLISRVKAIFCH